MAATFSYPKTHMSEDTIKQWLNEVSRTVAAKDLNAHLDLISRNVKLTGMPGFDLIDYASWANQCQHEFTNNLIRSVACNGSQVRATTVNRIMFKTLETVTAADGSRNAQGIEVLLEKEADGKWRGIQERILPEGETRHHGFVPN